MVITYYFIKGKEDAKNKTIKINFTAVSFRV